LGAQVTAESQEILRFWFEDTPQERWFSSEPALDAELRHRFEPLWRRGRNGSLAIGADTPDGALALVLLYDQFPRNMFRGKAEAFSTDAMAREVAKKAIAQGYDLMVPPERRQFFYMPLMHSENLADQERCIALVRARLGEASATFSFALRHRDVIARIGRFPARNMALGRPSTAEEKQFLAEKPLGF